MGSVWGRRNISWCKTTPNFTKDSVGALIRRCSPCLLLFNTIVYGPWLVHLVFILTFFYSCTTRIFPDINPLLLWTLVRTYCDSLSRISDRSVFSELGTMRRLCETDGFITFTKRGGCGREFQINTALDLVHASYMGYMAWHVIYSEGSWP